MAITLVPDPSLSTPIPADSSSVPTIVAFLSRYPPRSASRETMASGLRVIAALLLGREGAATPEETAAVPWDALRVEHAQAIRAKLVERYNGHPAGVNTRLAALKGILRQSWRLGRLDVDTLNRMVDACPGLRPDADARPGRVLTAEDVGRLLAACGARDRLLVVLGYACGLRRAEIAGLEAGALVGDTLTVKGKGGKTRQIPIPEWVGPIWRAWLAERGIGPGPLFGTGDKTVARVVAGAAARAGLGTVHPHDLRRTYLTGLLEAGVDLLVVQRLAGHARADTTARYDYRGDAAKRAAAARVVRPPGV